VNQAVDERQSGQRLIERAVGPEKLLGEQRQHVDPAAGGASFDRHAGCEINLGRQLQTERIAESILNNAAVDFHTPNNRLPAAHREPASPSGWYTAAVPGPLISDAPLCTDSTRPDRSTFTRYALHSSPQ